MAYFIISSSITQIKRVINELSAEFRLNIAKTDNSSTKAPSAAMIPSKNA